MNQTVLAVEFSDLLDVYTVKPLGLVVMAQLMRHARHKREKPHSVFFAQRILDGKDAVGRLEVCQG